MADLPEGEAVPADGSLPDPDVSKGFSAYVHIPFCAVRCGYCDFNTYTNLDFGPGASVSGFPDSLRREIALSQHVLRVRGSAPLLRTVFFGGGTPTMMNPAQLAGILRTLHASFGIAPGAEITTEANPESVTRESLRELAHAGFTRISFGMQSAVPHVLHTLERRHTPGQVTAAVHWARECGLDVSVDLIYGTPGESAADWETSVQAAIALGPDHISAYALTVEPGTAMGAKVRRGELRMPDPDEQAERYEQASRILEGAGYRWCEISNWAQPGHECRHNLAYWHNENWWGYGPGAHSHINGTRFWNVKHPLAYARALDRGRTPAAAREILNLTEREEEAVMLGIRLRDGIAIPAWADKRAVAALIADGLVDASRALRGRLVLTLRGRLLADTVTRALMP